jgi:hypothetical protein
VIDIQISAAALEPVAPFREPLERLGFVYREDNAERTKRYFREPPGQPRTHIHVRRAGSFSEQFPLLFRDYLRTHADEARAYGTLKRRLAQQFRRDRIAYTDAKVPFSGRSFAVRTAGRNRLNGSPGQAMLETNIVTMRWRSAAHPSTPSRSAERAEREHSQADDGGRQGVFVDAWFAKALDGLVERSAVAAVALGERLTRGGVRYLTAWLDGRVVAV